MTSKDILLASRLADAAGHAIRPFFRSEFASESKSDASPVTEADRAAEQAIRDILDAECPHDTIIGEEFGVKAGDSKRTWVLDPIDGTISFMAGRPIFGTLIALMNEGWPVMGVLDQCISGERWVGVMGRETTLNGKAVRTRPCKELSDAVLASSSPQYFDDYSAQHFMTLAAKTSKRVVWGGDCYNYALLASGHIDIVVESGLKLYDMAALIPIVEGAGGLMCDWNGEPLNEESEKNGGHVIAVGDPARLEDVLEGLTSNH